MLTIFPGSDGDFAVDVHSIDRVYEKAGKTRVVTYRGDEHVTSLTVTGAVGRIRDALQALAEEMEARV